MDAQRSDVYKDSGYEFAANVAMLAGVDVVSLQASDSQIVCGRCVQSIIIEQRLHD